MLRLTSAALVLMSSGVRAKGGMPCPYEWQDDTGMLEMFAGTAALSLPTQLPASILIHLDIDLFSRELDASNASTYIGSPAVAAKYMAWKEACAANPSTDVIAAGNTGYFYGLPCIMYKARVFTPTSNGVAINSCQESGDFIGTSVSAWNGFCRRYTKAGGDASAEDSQCRAWGKCGAVVSKDAFAQGQVAGMYQYAPMIDSMHAGGQFPMTSAQFFAAATVANAWVYDFCVANPHIEGFKIGMVPPAYRSILTAFDGATGMTTTVLGCFAGTKGPSSLYGILFDLDSSSKASPSGLLKDGNDYIGSNIGCQSKATQAQMSILYPPSMQNPNNLLYNADGYGRVAFKSAWASGDCCGSSCTIPLNANGVPVANIAVA